MKGLFMIKPKYGTIENKNKNKELLKKYPFLRPFLILLNLFI